MIKHLIKLVKLLIKLLIKHFLIQIAPGFIHLALAIHCEQAKLMGKNRTSAVIDRQHTDIHTHAHTPHTYTHKHTSVGGH